MKLRAVLFDGYGTLFRDAMEPLMNLCAQVVREEQLEMDARGFLDVWDRYFFPLIREDEFHTLREATSAGLERAFQELKLRATPARYVDSLFEEFGRSRVYDDVGPTLAGLERYATGIVSNADIDHLEQAIELNGLRFSVVVSSESARCYKPRPGILHEALDMIGCKPEEALYVGDSQEDDIVGARQAGMPVGWLNRKGKALKAGIPEPDYEIGTLVDVLEIV